ncbi:MAG: tRNA3(Ser)-specific nuclease WapA, partial [Chlamydiae bacterium]|nr:tRNA3(Ser)-specific nuclease WapA [Chlamydiota bacterium]
MFKVQLAAFFLFIGSLQATILDPGVEAATEGDPSSTLCNSVSILTGDFVVFSEDLVIDGVHPLRIHRHYASGNGKGKYGGWEFFPHLEIKTKSYKKKPSKKFKRAIVREPNGTHLVFKKQEKHSFDKGWVKFTIDFEKNGKGITNTSRGTISGRANLKNYTLSQVTDHQLLLRCADGTQRTYTYSHKDNTEQKMPVFLLRKEIHPNGHKTFYQYDSHHRIEYIKNTNMENSEIYAWCRFEYEDLFDSDTKAQYCKIETSDGRKLGYVFMCKGKTSKKPRYFLRSIQSPELPEEFVTYDKLHGRIDHLVNARVLPQGRNIRADYSQGRVETLYQSVGKKDEPIATHRFDYHLERNKPGSTDVYDAYQNKTTVCYSSRFLPQEVLYYEQDRLHHSIQSIWDEHGQLLEKIIADADGAPHLIRKYNYDKRGNLLAEELIGNITALSSHDTYAFEQDFDEYNRLIEKREPSGLVTKISYLERTPLIEEKTITDGRDIHIEESYKYNRNNILIEKRINDRVYCKIQKIHPKKEAPALDLPEIIEEWAHDLSTGEEILISKIHLHYNKLAKVIQKDIYGSDNKKHHSLKYKYDYRGKLIEEEKPLEQITSYEYDYLNNIVLQKDPTQKETHLHYDAANRIIEERETTPEEETRITQHEYDYKNNKTATIDPFGNKTLYEYDAFSHITKTIHPDGSKETFTYDLLGNMTSHTDPLGNTLQKTYNSLGKPLLIIHPDHSQEIFEYYPDGNLKSHTNQDNLTIEHKYDALGRETALFYYDSNGTQIAEESLEYEGSNLHRSIDKEGIPTTYEYDATGRKTANQRANARIEYEYDVLGRVHKEKQINEENTLITTYQYDLLNQVTQEIHQDLEDHILYQVSHTYDKQGNRTTTTKDNSEEHFTYDNFNRLIYHENGEGHRTIIAYDENHINEDNQRVLRKVTTDPMNYRTIETYDILMRLVDKTIHNPYGHTISSEEYHLDPNGNCLTQRCHIYEDINYFRTLVISKEYDSMNRVTSIQEGAYTPEEKTAYFTYTPSGKLKQTEKPDGTLLTYQYDTFGNHIELHSSDNTIHYTYTYDLNSNLL